MFFLPSQSVNDLRYDLSTGAVMTYITLFGPAGPVSSIPVTPTAIVWS